MSWLARLAFGRLHALSAHVPEAERSSLEHAVPRAFHKRGMARPMSCFHQDAAQARFRLPRWVAAGGRKRPFSGFLILQGRETRVLPGLRGEPDCARRFRAVPHLDPNGVRYLMEV